MALQVQHDYFQRAEAYCIEKLSVEGDRLEEQNKKVLTIFMEWCHVMTDYRNFSLDQEPETSWEAHEERVKIKRDKCDVMFSKFRALVPLAGKVFVSQWPPGDWRRKFWFEFFQKAQSIVIVTSVSSCGMQHPCASMSQKLTCVSSVFLLLSQASDIYEERVLEAAEEEASNMRHPGGSSSGEPNTSELPSVAEMLTGFIKAGKQIADGIEVATDVVKKAALLKESCTIL
jgi:hypothetical protein